MAINVKWLYAFRAIIDAGTVTGASALMYLTQPQLSRMLSSLERELGMDLFHRDGRRLVPTPEGLEFYRTIQPTLRALDRVPREAEAIRTGRERPFQVAAEPFLMHALVPDAIARMAPDLTASLTVEPCMREAGLWSARSDVACSVVALPFTQSDYAVRPFAVGELVAAVPEGGPLAGTDAPLAFAEIEEHRFIALRSSTLMRAQIDLAAAKAGITLRPWAETSSGATALNLVARGLGVTIADPVIASAFAGKGVALRRLDTVIALTYGFLVKPDQAALPEALAFQSVCEDLALAAGGGFVRLTGEGPG